MPEGEGDVVTFNEWLDSDIPCYQCGHARWFHSWPGLATDDGPECHHAICFHAIGTPDSCECLNYLEPTE
jgi:hypothetical protein